MSPMRILTPLLAFVLLVSTAHAEENFGLSMHGKPKYTAASKNLDYANPEAPKGGSVTQSAIGTFDTLNPFSIKGKAAQGLNMYYDRLMARVWDEPFTMYPLIAEKVVVADNRSAITFYLNPKAQFNDRTKITAEDVIFSFNTLKEHGRPNMRNVYKLVSAVGETNDGGIAFTFGPGYDRETAMIIAMMPVLSKKWWKDRDFEAGVLEIPLSSGPYLIKSVEAGRSITYERNKNYWAKDLLTNVGHYNFDTIKYDYFRDDGVAFESFKTGDISLRLETDSGRWRRGYTIAPTKKDELMKEEIAHQRPERTLGMIFNTRREPFNDILVRRALEMVLDFNNINKILFNKDYKQIESYYPNSELAWPHDEEEEDANTDTSLRNKIKAAGELLTEAGWEISKGIRVKEGKPFEFEILLSAPEDEKIALHYQKTLNRLGITMKIRTMDSAAFIDRLQNYDYDMVMYYWQFSLSPGSEQILYWGCNAAKEPGRFNYAGICDTEVERLTKRIAETTSREDLVGTVQKLDRLLMAGHYMIPLYYAGYDRYAYWKPLARPEKAPIYGTVQETWWMEPTLEPSPTEQSATEDKTAPKPADTSEPTKTEEKQVEEQTTGDDDISELMALDMLDDLAAQMEIMEEHTLKTKEEKPGIDKETPNNQD